MTRKERPEVDLSKTWEEVDWLTIREEMANLALHTEAILITDEERGGYTLMGVTFREHFEEESSKKWDEFYSNNKAKFFKDRNYLK